MLTCSLKRKVRILDAYQEARKCLIVSLEDVPVHTRQEIIGVIRKLLERQIEFT